MKVANLNRESITFAWLTSKLPVRYQRDFPGLTGTFFVKGTYRLQAGEVAVPWPDKPLFPAGDVKMPGGGNRYPSDFVPYKEHAEWFVVGKAHGPGQAGLTSFEIGVEIGEQLKELQIHGQREWSHGMLGETIGPAAPIAPTELCYANAWGGKEEALNPVGCGKETGNLPLIEMPGMPIMNRLQGVPAGFAPIPLLWPQRYSRVGTYHAPWAEERWPWFPDDFDAQFFQAAPASQWASSYWRGDEMIRLTNILKGQPHYQAQLPKVQARCYIERIESKELEAVPLNLDTLWIDADQEQLVLVWRGRCAASNPKLHDIGRALVLTEPLDTPAMEPEAFRDQFEKGFKPPPFPRGRSARKRVPVAQRVQLKRVQAQKEMHESRVAAYRELKAIREKQPDLGPVFDSAKEAMPAEPKPYTPPGPDALEGLDAHYQSEYKKMAADFPKLSAAVKPPNPPGELAKGAQASAAAAAKKGEKVRQRFAPKFKREDFLREDGKPDLKKLRKEGAVNVDLSKLDFSGRPVIGINFRGARLAGANFAGAILMGSDFTGADLTGANLSEARLTLANMTEADLSRCQVDRTDWRKAVLRGAILSGLDLSGADFYQVSAVQADFTKCQLKATKFTEAKLIAASFTQADMEEADFTGADLTFADFRRVTAKQAIFVETTLANFRGREGSDFSGADFSRAKGAKPLFDKANLEGCRFLDADLEGGRFTRSKAPGASFRRARLMNTKWEEAILTDCDFVRANLLRSNFDRADLTRAVLDHSNLYGSGMWETVLHGVTWHEAFIKRTKLDF